VEWTPDRIIWYIDDLPVRTVYDGTGAAIPQYAMAVILNFAIDPYQACLPANWNTPLVMPHQNKLPTLFPQYFEIDYLRYYKLNTDCNTNLTICVPGNYDRKVKKTIITNNTCTPTYNPSTVAASYTLRATDYVTLDVGTDINPTGTGYFAVDVIACPQ